jgi:hypothetical protein
LGYSGILKRLKALRKEGMCNYTADAASARKYFCGNLEHNNAHGAFRYKKSGKWLVVSSDKQIAVRWRRLLESREDIREELGLY